MNLNHIRIPRNKHKNGVFNIQLLNNYHARLKGMINIRFKGVATKYLNNYLVYHNFVNFAKESEIEKNQFCLALFAKHYAKVKLSILLNDEQFLFRNYGKNYPIY